MPLNLPFRRHGRGAETGGPDEVLPERTRSFQYNMSERAGYAREPDGPELARNGAFMRSGICGE